MTKAEEIYTKSPWTIHSKEHLLILQSQVDVAEWVLSAMDKPDPEESARALYDLKATLGDRYPLLAAKKLKRVKQESGGDTYAVDPKEAMFLWKVADSLFCLTNAFEKLQQYAKWRTYEEEFKKRHAEAPVDLSSEMFDRQVHLMALGCEHATRELNAYLNRSQNLPSRRKEA